MECLDAGIVFGFGANDQDVCVGGIGSLEQQGVAGGVESGGECVVGVDDGGIDVGQDAGELCAFEFANFQVGRQGAQGGGAFGNESGGLQEFQGAACVGGIVGDGDGDLGFVFEGLQVVEFFGVDAEGFDVDAGGDAEIGVVVGVELFEVGDVLEEVGIDVALEQGDVGLYVVGDFDDLDVDAFFGEQGFGVVEDLGVWDGAGADFEGVIGLFAFAGQEREGDQQEGKKFVEFHRDSVGLKIGGDELAVVVALCDAVAEGLHELNHDDEDDDGGEHDVGLEALVAVADGKVAEAAAADGTGHGGVRD